MAFDSLPAERYFAKLRAALIEALFNLNAIQLSNDRSQRMVGADAWAPGRLPRPLAGIAQCASEEAYERVTPVQEAYGYVASEVS